MFSCHELGVCEEAGQHKQSHSTERETGLFAHTGLVMEVETGGESGTAEHNQDNQQTGSERAFPINQVQKNGVYC